MPSPRKAREAAVQFLYCSDLEGGADPADLLEPFWQCVTESDQRRLLTAVFRSIHHLAKGRTARIKQWRSRQQAALPLLSTRPETEELAMLLERLGRMEAEWSRALEQLQRLSLDGQDEVIAPRLQSELNCFFSLETRVSSARQQLLQGLTATKALATEFEALAGSTRSLQRISERLAMLEHPENFPEQADLAKLRDSKEQIGQLRVATQKHLDRISAQRARIDAALASVVENFAPERINPVDRAILRLACSELMDRETPDKVVINEAVEIAKRFGTGDSSRFVNGVLDKVASLLRAAPEN